MDLVTEKIGDTYFTLVNNCLNEGFAETSITAFLFILSHNKPYICQYSPFFYSKKLVNYNN